MTRVLVPSTKSGFGAKLPIDMANPGYWDNSNKESLSKLARYVNKEEWAELANGANAAHNAHSATSNGCVMGLLFGTCGVCFCPLLCYGCCVDVEQKCNEDIQKLPITQRLKARGISVHFIPKKGKFNMGGMECIVAPRTPPAPPLEGKQITLQVLIPPGTPAGAPFVAQLKDGREMQVTPPPGSQPGDIIAVALARS